MIMEFTYYPYTVKNVGKVEKRWGIYKLASSSKRILFIGRGNLQKRLPIHLPNGKSPAEGVEYFSIEYYDSGEDAMETWKELLQEHRDKFGKVPEYNKPLDD